MVAMSLRNGKSNSIEYFKNILIQIQKNVAICIWIIDNAGSRIILTGEYKNG